MDRLSKIASSSTSPTKSTTNGNIKFLAPTGERTTKPITLTIAHFVDVYSKGKWNLSGVPLPSCISNPSTFQPPECYNESSRRELVRQFNNLPHWKETSIFKKIISRIRAEFSMNGISITIVDSTRVLIKFEHLLDLTDIPRIASIDSHTILSHGHFLLLDASKDWRTNQNPFVIGIPRIKFYLGVPLITKNGTVIGALSIFDSFGKRDFPSEKIKSFQNYAKEIMNVLDTPIEKLDKTNKKTTVSSLKLNEEFDGIKSLTRKIGRATSKGEQMTNIFEKDGSGGPYTQNSSFRFSRFNGKDDSDKINQLLFEKLFNCGNLKNGGTQLARFISSKFEVDFVYILEIRIAELYQIQKDFFPLKEKKVDAERFKHSNKLTKLTDDKGSNEGKKGNEYITRIIGHHGYNYTNLHFENEIHYAAFIAEFGIHYQNVRETSLYNDGIIMPFFRLNSKLIRKNRIKKGSTNDNIGDLEGNIDVYLRSGGYLIACFNEGIKKDAFNTNMISNVFEYASILRKIFISS